MYTLMFWNGANEALIFGGCQSQLAFGTHEEAMEAANAFILNMAKRGAVEATVHSPYGFETYPIIED